MDIPKPISVSWLRQRETLLACTAKSLDDAGTPNPEYQRLADDIAQARRERDRWDGFVRWVQRTLNAVLNQYPLRAEQVYLPGTVFLRKDRDSGKTTYWTIDKAWALYCAAHPEEALES